MTIEAIMNGDALKTTEGQRWLRWVFGLSIAITVAWFGIESRVSILEARLVRLESQVDRVENKVDRLLYRGLENLLTPLPGREGGGG